MRWTGGLATTPFWGEIANREQKQEIGRIIAGQVAEGDVIGVGSGSTALVVLEEIGRRLARENIRCTAVTTSYEMELACAAFGVPTTSTLAVRPDWVFDGADEVDPDRSLIKGRGGALFKEKMLIAAARRVLIAVDASKLVERLGARFPVPVEVHPFAVHLAEERLRSLGATEVVLRTGKGKDGPIVTEAGNMLLDARFPAIEPVLEKEIKAITGVIESGLFCGYPVEIMTV